MDGCFSLLSLNTFFRFNANRNSPLVAERQNLKEGVRVPPSWARVVEGEGCSKNSERTSGDQKNRPIFFFACLVALGFVRVRVCVLDEVHL